MNVNREDFRLETVPDRSPDLSYLGEYDNTPEPVYIDRKARGDMGRGEYRYYNAGCGDPEYIENDYARHEAYNRGDWTCIGVRAVIDLEIPCKAGGTIRQTITSPGIWGIESDSGDDYMATVFQDECEQLAEMLEAMGITVEGEDHATNLH